MENRPGIADCGQGRADQRPRERGMKCLEFEWLRERLGLDLYYKGCKD